MDRCIMQQSCIMHHACCLTEELLFNKNLLKFQMNSISAAIHIVNSVELDCHSKPPSSKTGTKPLRKKSKAPAYQKRVVIDLLDSENLLSNLFPVRDTENFSSSHFKRNPVVARGDQECLRKLKKLLFNLDISELIKSSASDRIHVWLSQRLPTGLNSNTLESIPVEDHTAAVKLYWAGHSIYCRAPLELEKAVVPKLLNELGLGITGSGTDRYRRGEIELFLSRAGHVTDFQENFTIQLSGRKKWIFRDSTAGAPLRGCTPHFKALGKEKSSILGVDQAATDLSEQQLKVLRLGDSSFSAHQYVQAADQEHSVVLGPGDVMYHPAGIWHKVECEEDSVSINISLIVSSHAEIFCSGLLQLLWENPVFRGSVSTDGADGIAGSLRVMESMMAAVPAILFNMRASDFLPAPCLNGSNASVADGSDAEGDIDEDSGSKIAGNRGFSIPPDEGSVEDSSNEEEEEVEEEEEEEENHNALAPIYPGRIKVPTFLNSEFDDTYRINPLVKVVTSTDIRCFERGASVSVDALPSEAFIVHSGFGNETFESVLRQVVVVPQGMVCAARVLVGAIAEHQVQRQLFFVELEEKKISVSAKRKRDDTTVDCRNWGNKDIVTVNNMILKSSTSLDKNIVWQLLQAFVAAGALTLV